jgi:integrase
MVRTPSYRRHKASGKAVVTLAGKDHYLGVFGSPESKQLYKRLLAEYLAANGEQPGKTSERLSISQLFARFLRFAKQYYGTKSNSRFWHYGRLANRIRKIYGPTMADEFGSVQFKAIRQQLISEGLSRSYCNETMGRLVRVFRWASGEEIVPPGIGHVLRDIEPLKRGRSKARETDPILPVHDDVVEKTIPHLPPVVADMVRLQRLIGCRPGEVCTFTPSLVDRTKGDIWEIRLKYHKTAWRGKERVIYVGPKAQKILAPYLLRATDEPCFQPQESERKRREKLHEERVTPLSCGNKPGSRRKQRRKGLIPAKVGTSQPGKQYTVASYARAIKRACDSAFPPPDGLNEQQQLTWIKSHRWSPNQLRHTFGTMIRREFGLEETQLLLGHSNASTSEIYAETDKEKARVAARRIG